MARLPHPPEPTVLVLENSITQAARGQCMLCTLLAVFSVSVTRTHLAPVQLAGIVATH
jgi:hypothetical protein